MSKQCQHRSQCPADATWGLYAWKMGETNVNLKKPVKVYCGRHKPRPQRDQLLRLVKLPRATGVASKPL